MFARDKLSSLFARNVSAKEKRKSLQQKGLVVINS
jgi:hypothetical protein